jgi:hypothetical protein
MMKSDYYDGGVEQCWISMLFLSLMNSILIGLNCARNDRVVASVLCCGARLI